MDGVDVRNAYGVVTGRKWDKDADMVNHLNFDELAGRLKPWLDKKCKEQY